MLSLLLGGRSPALQLVILIFFVLLPGSLSVSASLPGLLRRPRIPCLSRSICLLVMLHLFDTRKLVHGVKPVIPVIYTDM